MARTTKIIISIVILAMGVLAVLQLTGRDGARPLDGIIDWATSRFSGEDLPEGVKKVRYKKSEIKAMEERVKDRSEIWRIDAIEVVKHERKRLGVPENTEIREHGQYVIRADGVRETLIFALMPDKSSGEQVVVRVEEHEPGFWVPVETGPFITMINRLGSDDASK